MCTSERFAFNVFDVDLPQLFPGLIYRMIKPKVVLLIFVSGKIVLTGAKVGTNFIDHDQTYRSIDMSTDHHLLPARSERRFTRLSTRSTLYSANSANLEHFTMSRRSHLDPLHHPSHIRPPQKPCPPFVSMLFLPGDGLLADGVHDVVGCISSPSLAPTLARLELFPGS